VISLIWFKDSLLFATAEEGMTFYRSERTAEVYSNIIYDNGTGFVEPLTLPRAPLYYFSSYLELLLPNYIVQQIIFALLIFSAIYGVYLLASELGFSKKVSSISGLFYFFNLFTMSQVWKRTVYSGIFAWAYLPIFLVLWIKWLKRGEYVKLVILLLTSLIFSYIYANPGFLLALWFPAIIYTSIGVFKKHTKYILRSLIAFILWMLVNIWWIYPYISAPNPRYGDTNLLEKSFESLRGVSVSFPLSEILLLKQKGYFKSSYNPQMAETSWGLWYEDLLPEIISLMILSIMLIGWWNSRKKNYWLFISSLAFVGLFISKGTNPPFGYVFFNKLFTFFPIFQVMRNSYEKFGIVWLLPYSFFFGLGVEVVSTRIKSTINKKFISGMILLLAMTILVWPMWTGKLFEKYYFVSIPKYYQELNEFLYLNDGDYRILIAPLLPDHGVALNWGYRGDDPSIFLFDKTAISKRITYPFYTEKYDELKKKIDEEETDTKTLNQLNIKYIVLNKDYRWDIVGTKEIDMTEEFLVANDQLKYIDSFVNLELYENREYLGGIITLEGDSVPEFEYRKLGKNKFEVLISEAKESFTLVLKNNYDDRWQARVSGDELASHHIIYGYANAWNLEMKGSYRVVLNLKIYPWD